MSTYTRNLIAEGYGVLPSSQSCTFLVIKPTGDIYEANPVRKSCTCAAGQAGRPCCHLTQLQTLLRHESRRMLALSAETPMLAHELQLVSEVEALVAKWKEVKALRQTSVCTSPTARRFAIYGQLHNKAWVTVLRGFHDEVEAERQRQTIRDNFYRQTSVRPDRSFVHASVPRVVHAAA